MSKRLIENLLKEVFKVADGSRIRKDISKNQHIVTITHSNLKEAYKDSYISLTKKDESLPDPRGWKIFDAAATEAIKLLKLHASPTSKTKSYELPETMNNKLEIKYRSPKNSESPLKIIKRTGLAYIKSKLNESGRRLSTREDMIKKGVPFAAAASASQIGQFNTKIEIHHKETTIGAAQLAASLNKLGTTKYFRNFLQSDELKSLRGAFGSFDLKFEVDLTDFKVSIREDAHITVDIGSYRTNTAGSEPNDWKYIAPALQKAIIAWARNEKWFTRKGSPSPQEDGIQLVEHKIMSELKQIKGAKVMRKTSAPKRNPSQTGIVVAGVVGKNKRNTKKARSYKPRAKSRGVSSSPLALIALLNAQLPGVVTKNMSLPGLENRTGRFAGSVRVTDILQTARGFPSVGYTYDTFPYQTFEPGYAQGSVDRDPRKVINLSIREIASQYAIGRFYTRRV